MKRPSSLPVATAMNRKIPVDGRAPVEDTLDPRSGRTFAQEGERSSIGSEQGTRGDLMSSTIQVAAARIPDRDRLLRELQEHGLDARAVDEIGIEVRSDNDQQAISNEVFSEVE